MKATRLTQHALAALALSLAINSPALAQNSSGKEKAELRERAAAPDVQEELEAPDGVSIELLPGGGWRIFSKGTGTYDFNDAEEIRVATRQAEMRAKAAIAKFLEEKVRSEDSLTNLTKKTKLLSSWSGANAETSVEVSKTSVQVTVERISSNAKAVVAGIITLESRQVPQGNGGTVSVLVGISEKSLQLAGRVGEALRARGAGATTDGRESGGKTGGDHQSKTTRAKTDL
jgi:hypothetical protein